MLKIEPFLKKFSTRVFVKLSQLNSPRKWCVVSWMNKHMCAHSHRSNSSAYSCRRRCDLVLSIRFHSLSFKKKLTSWLTKLLSWLTQSLPFKNGVPPTSTVLLDWKPCCPLRAETTPASSLLISFSSDVLCLTTERTFSQSPFGILLEITHVFSNSVWQFFEVNSSLQHVHFIHYIFKGIFSQFVIAVRIKRHRNPFYPSPSGGDAHAPASKSLSWFCDTWPK